MSRPGLTVPREFLRCRGKQHPRGLSCRDAQQACFQSAIRRIPLRPGARACLLHCDHPAAAFPRLKCTCQRIRAIMLRPLAAYAVCEPGSG